MSRNIRICMLASRFPPVPAGGGQQALTLSKQLVKSGASVLCIAGYYSNAPKTETIDGVRIFRYTFPTRLPFGSWIWGLRILLPLLLKIRQFDILHIHGPNIWSLPALILAKTCGKKVVVKMATLGDDDPIGLREQRLGRIKEKSVIWGNAIVSISSALTERCQLAGISEDKLWQVPNSVDMDKFRPVSQNQRKKIRNALDLPEQAPIVLFVGIVNKRKGVDILIEAWNELKKKGFEDGVLVLAGDNTFDLPFSNIITEKLNAWKIQNSVRFTGHVTNIDDYMKSADLFVFPTRNEGLPNALLEAMATALPCVVRDIPGITKDIVTHRENGIIIEEDNPQKFAYAIADLLEKRDLRAKLGDAARNVIKQRFNIVHLAERYIELYGNLLKN